MSQYTQLRLSRLQKFVKKEQFDGKPIDAFLITNPTNVTYLSGFTGDSTYLLVLPQKSYLLSDSRYTIQLSQQSPEIPALIRNQGQGLFALAEEILAQEVSDSSGTIGIEADCMPMAEYLNIKVSADKKGYNLSPIMGAVERLRSIKDKYEIEQTRKAVEFAIRGFEMIRAGLRPDQTERDLAIELEYQMRKKGADDDGFPTIVGVGQRAALPHAVPGLTKVADGDFVLFDWGAAIGGYRSDLTRVLLTGKKTPKFKKIYNIVRNAQAAAIEAIKPGVACREIDAIARGVIEKAGFGAYFGHGLGHSVGLEIHESPMFSPKCDALLEPGMILTVEPGIYLEDWGGVRLEDDILVTKNGCEVLTRGLSSLLEDMTL